MAGIEQICARQLATPAPVDREPDALFEIVNERPRLNAVERLTVEKLAQLRPLLPRIGRHEDDPDAGIPAA